MTFYQETKFQETSIGKIPADWVTAKVEEIGEVVSGFGFSVNFQGKKNGKYPFVKVGDMNLSSKYTTTAENYIDDTDLKALKAKVFPPNTLIFPKIGMSIYLNKYRILKVWCTFDNNVAGIIPKKIDPEFLFYYFKGCVDLKQISNRTTTPSIRKTALECMLMPTPRIEEQRCIVGILGVVDSALELADRVIAKTERLKKGLMQQLLTHGMGYTEYEHAAIGTIPSDWTVVRIKDIASVKEGIYGKRGNGNIIQLKADSISNNGKINATAYAKISSDRDISNYLLQPGDILFNNRNSADLVGKSAVFMGEFNECVYSNLLTRIRLHSKELTSQWVVYSLTKLHETGRLKDLSTRAVNQALLKKETVENLIIPIPPSLEQNKITEILLATDKKLELEKDEKIKLERVKQGLMDLLLTGKVRIKVD